MAQRMQQKGELFSRLYIESGAPAQDSAAFRTRLSGFLENYSPVQFPDLAKILKTELGVHLESWGSTMSMYYNVPKFFQEASIEHVLSAITLIWRYLQPKMGERAWHDFVVRAMREENLGYSLDDLCGAHYLVDEEFERNRVSVLRAADAPQFAAVRKAFELAHSYLDSQPADTKASVRSMFEAVEILARLMDPTSTRLTKALVVGNLKTMALAAVTDSVEQQSLGRVFDGLGNWVDAMHIYRHGQGTPDPVAPSIAFAVYALSSGAAALRLLLGVASANP